MKKLILYVSSLFILSVPGWASAAPLEVFVSIPPQKYFLRKIGGDRIHVQVMVLPGANPATYEPKPKQMVALSRSKAYFSIGVPFEKAWLPRITRLYKELQIISTDQGITKRFVKDSHSGRTPVDGKGESIGRGEGRDPHIWLSPPLVMVQARNILEGLSLIDPSHRGLYEKNFVRFTGRLRQLNGRLRALLNAFHGRSFLVFHPSWGYFADAYGLRQIAIESEGKPPGPAHLSSFMALAKKEGAKAIFVQPQFSAKSARIIARAISARIVPADPLAEDWVQNLLRVAESLGKTLQ